VKPPHVRENAVIIEGILVPVVWNASGHPAALAVAAYDENHYWLAHDDAVAKWRALIGHRVIARGRCVDKDNKLWLALESIEPV
jgi:hypothetical protein